MPTDQQIDSAEVRVFPPAVPLAVVLIGVGLNYLWPIDAGFTVPAFMRFWVGGLIIAGSFSGLGTWSFIIMRRTGQSENPWKPTTEIIERGPFRITRNPMYLQMMLISIGIALVLVNLWILFLAPIGGWALQKFAILPEEAYLERKFGDAYLAYKQRVRRWI